MRHRNPIHALPSDYKEVRCFVATDPGNLLALNLLAFVLLGVGLGAMLGWVALLGRVGLSSPVFNADGISSWLLWAGVIAVFPLHEWIHGIAILGTGHKPRYGAIFAPLWRLKIPVALYATADDAYFRRGEFIVITLLPLVAITVLGMFLLGFAGNSLAWYVILAVVLNAGGAVGDLWMTAIIMRCPASVLVKDEADRIRIFRNVAD